MKTNFIKKTVMLAAVVVTLLLSSAFIAKEKKVPVDYNDFYIYVYFSDKNDDNKTIYVSDAIHYEGQEKCSQSYNWKPKVEKAFKAYIEANYNNVNPNYTYMIGSTTGYYLSSNQEANEALNEWISKEKGRGNSITKTSFNYYCE